MQPTTPPRHSRARTAGIVLVVTLEAALAVVDVVTPGSIVFTSAYLIAPLTLALFATPRVVAGVGALPTASAIDSTPTAATTRGVANSASVSGAMR